MQSVQEFFKDIITRFEIFRDKRGKLITYQDLSYDAGNVKGPDGKIIGTNWGVSPRTYALYKNISIKSVTIEQMKNLTLEEAIDIGIKLHYEGPGFNRLPWSAETSIWVEIGWGSSSKVAITAMQKMIGAGQDGTIGPQTIKIYTDWLNKLNREEAINNITDWRIAYYNYIVQIRPANEKFLQTWITRANFYRTTNPLWWNNWIDSPEQFTSNQITSMEQEYSNIDLVGKPIDIPEGYTSQINGNLVRENINESPTIDVANKGMWISGIITSIFGIGGIGTFLKSIPEVVLIILFAGGIIAGLTILVYFLFIKKRRINDNEMRIR